ncbi:hypothetical protein CL6EHI_182870 [Entamoeba histolytica]|uniref:F-BAR domain-containing protein n=3 Tax=Entamoeba histolytica TaxID=5759 RepID=C4LV66_ENTH1|nr:hypothetical protein EHI_182870 [Entamoeba histolytica HM-1:IMSS]EAL49767.2 hypothetical protein EHI_182870 [Entamoeba histolytica HM-1:IMSS]ENY63908.1 hypothetical protein EHI7A_021480 [Entamoeba histolytica HM-1:IMSS-A]GAT92550.1 hypothetical protein CL6EHI_182870 [Entamoeba histolytica]|eukprot:XP_655153.2 hypothetical protein EHI_182870 [Entamoeba histolytica HM-1:IMSS]
MTTTNSELYKSCVFEINSIVHQLDALIDVTKEYGEYYQGRGTLEIEYGKKLLGLITYVNTPSFGKEDSKKFLQTGMKSYFELLDTSNTKRVEEKYSVGKKLLEEVATPLFSLAKEIDTQKKKIVNEAVRKVKIYEDVASFALRCEGHYLNVLKDMKDLTKKINETNDSKSIPKYNKMNQQYSIVKKDYENSVNKASECYDLLYGQEMVETVRQCYELMTYHNDEIINIFKHAHQIYLSIGINETEFNSVMSDGIKTLDNKTDVKEFFESIIGHNEKSKVILKTEELAPLQVEAPKEPQKKWGFGSIKSSIVSGVSSLTTMVNESIQNPSTGPSASWTNPVLTTPIYSFGKKKESKKETHDSKEEIKEEVTDIKKQNEVTQEEKQKQDNQEEGNIVVVEKEIKVEGEVVAEMVSNEVPQIVEVKEIKNETIIPVKEEKKDEVVLGSTSIMEDILTKEESEDSELVVVPATDNESSKEEDDDDEEVEEEEEPTNTFI